MEQLKELRIKEYISIDEINNYYFGDITPSHKIAVKYGKTDSELAFYELELYHIKKMSAEDIVKKFYQDTQIPITARSIQRLISMFSYIRSTSEHHKLAIKQGKLDNYINSVKIINKVNRKTLPKILRYKILSKFNFSCVTCGSSAEKDNPIQVDHIDGNPNNQKEDNLQVLCRNCNLGKHYLNNKKE